MEHVIFEKSGENWAFSVWQRGSQWWCNGSLELLQGQLWSWCSQTLHTADTTRDRGHKLQFGKFRSDIKKIFLPKRAILLRHRYLERWYISFPGGFQNLCRIMLVWLYQVLAIALLQPDVGLAYSRGLLQPTVLVILWYTSLHCTSLKLHVLSIASASWAAWRCCSDRRPCSTCTPTLTEQHRGARNALLN